MNWAGIRRRRDVQSAGEGQVVLEKVLLLKRRELEEERAEGSLKVRVMLLHRSFFEK